MIDFNGKLLLLLQDNLASVENDRIIAGSEFPRNGINPIDGPIICFQSRGGPFSYQPLIAPSIQFKIYAVNNFLHDQIYRELFDLLIYNCPPGYGIMSVIEESIGVPLYEPENNWLFNLSFFRFIFINKLE